MRNDSAKWDRLRTAREFELSPKVRLKRVDGLQLTLLSGPRVLEQIDLPQIGWPDLAPLDPHAVMMRRDRVLIVGGASLPEGWDETTNQVASDMSHGYAVFDLSGPGALDVLQVGTELFLDRPSRSAARLAFGLGLLIHRFTDEHTYRIFVPRYHADALIAHLKAAGQQGA